MGLAPLCGPFLCLLLAAEPGQKGSTKQAVRSVRGKMGYRIVFTNINWSPCNKEIR